MRDAHVIGPAALSRVPPGRVQGTEGDIACRIQHVPRVPAMYSFALAHCHVSIVEFARVKINCFELVKKLFAYGVHYVRFIQPDCAKWLRLLTAHNSVAENTSYC